MSFSNEYLLRVDIKRRLSSVVPTFKQGDNGVLKFEIYDNGRKYDLSGYTYSEITFRMPSGKSIVGNPVLGSDGILTYNFTGVEMAEVGRVETIVSIYSGNTMVSIQPFFCFIYDSMKGEDLSYIGILQDLIAEVQLLRTEVTEAVIEANEALTEAKVVKEEVENLNTNITAQEEIRDNNETQRISNENTRISNEDSRKVDEQTREQNEQTREANEVIRQQSLTDMNTIIAQFKTTGTYNSNTTYKKFNQVEFEGSTYIALIDNTNVPVSNTATWRLLAKKGEKGDKGDTGAALSILGSLTEESQLPPTGNSGDAYTVNGELYVWSENTGKWENVGNIKGEKGDKGDTGGDGDSAYQIAVDNGFVGTSEEWLASLKGEKGKDADLTEVNANILTLRQDYDEVKKEVTEHLVEYEKLENRVTVLEEGSNTTKADVAGLNREVAHLKLKQDASDRIDGGTVFADDMNGQRFGFTLNEDDSKGIKIQDGKMLMLDEDKTNYDIAGATVVAQPYSTEGNSGRKITMLENGWLVAVLWDATSKTYPLYVSKDDGLTWELEYTVDSGTLSNGNCGISSFANTVTLVTGASDRVYASTYDVVNKSLNTLGLVDNTQTDISSVSIDVDKKTGHLHASWSSKRAAQPSSFNIRYSKSTDSGKTWSSPLPVTTVNSPGYDNTVPVITVLPNGNPYLLFNNKTLTDSRFYSYTWDGAKFNNNSTIYNGGSNVQSNPTAVVDKDGTIHVAWDGGNGSGVAGTAAICYSKSTDGGVSWSSAEIITPQSTRGNPSIAIDRDNKVVIVYRVASTSRIQLSKITNTSGSWSSEEFLTTITSGSNAIIYPSTLDNNTLNFDTPPLVYNDYSTNSIKFMGKWSVVVETPTTEATAVYDIPSTNYVGAFVQKIGNVTVSAKINDTVMVSELENNEYEFTGSIPDVVPVKLSLYLKRESVANGENDAITRILGGRS